MSEIRRERWAIRSPGKTSEYEPVCRQVALFFGSRAFFVFGEYSDIAIELLRIYFTGKVYEYDRDEMDQGAA